MTASDIILLLQNNFTQLLIQIEISPGGKNVLNWTSDDHLDRCTDAYFVTPEFLTQLQIYC